MQRDVLQAVNPLSIHVTFTAIVPGAYPGEAKMCLRLIAETDARSVGDSHPSCSGRYCRNLYHGPMATELSQILVTSLPTFAKEVMFLPWLVRLSVRPSVSRIKPNTQAVINEFSGNS